MGFFFDDDISYIKNIFNTDIKVDNIDCETIPAFCYSLDNLDYLEECAKKACNIKQFILLGTGGSTMVTQALSGIYNDKIIFCDDLHVDTIRGYINKIDSNTGLIVISKSGETIETLAQYDIFSQYIPNEKTYIITEKKDSTLYRLSNNTSTFIEHDSNIGGRYSCFSSVGLFPCMLIGLDHHLFLKGMIDAIRNKEEITKVAQMKYDIIAKYGIKNYIMLNYSDWENGLMHWWRQLWSESLGKNGYSVVPILSKGTIDQHSQLQMYLDSGNNFVETSIYNSRDDILLSNNFIFKNIKIGDILKAEYEATSKALSETNNFIIKNYTERSEYYVGYFMSKWIIQIVYIAQKLNINPFDQPAVEQIKTNTYKILAQYK